MVNLIHMAVRIIPTLSDRPVVDALVGVLEEALETRNERIRDLESQATSKDEEIVAKVAQADSLERCLRVGKEGA